MSQNNQPAVGANNASSANTTFANIQSGEILVRREKPNDITVSREITKAGFEKTVHEEHYNELTGKMTEVLIKDGDYGFEVKVTFDLSSEESNEKWIVSMPLNSGPADCLLKRLNKAKNFIFHKIKTGESQYINSKGEKKTNYWLSLQVWDNGKWVKIESEYTKENPNGLPDVKQVVINGKPQWDKTERFGFYKRITESFNAVKKAVNPVADTPPSVQNTHSNTNEQSNNNNSSFVYDSPEVDEDDLPF